jgi:hypothetical protein
MLIYYVGYSININDPIVSIRQSFEVECFRFQHADCYHDLIGTEIVLTFSNFFK